jgi:predicted dehydrogenase
MASESYVTTLVDAGVRIVACADVDADRATALARRCDSAPRAVDEVMSDDDIDLLLNLTPPRAHASLTRAFLEAGKSVYSEKPLAFSASEAADLVDLATDRGVALVCAPESAVDPRWDALVHLLRIGLIGDPIAAAVDLVNDPAAWHPRPAFLYEPGGGPLWDLAPYGLTLLTMLFGPISRVTARERGAPSRYEQVATDVSAMVDFESGFTATIGVSYDRRVPFGPPLVVFGADGAARFTGSGLAYEGELEVSRHDDATWTPIPIDHRPVHVRGRGVVDLVDAMAQRRAPRLDVRVAVHVVEVLEAIEQSCARGESVTVDSRAGVAYVGAHAQVTPRRGGDTGGCR